MPGKKVIIIGGGVGGMSAAHELIERGFEVEVYDKNPTYVGGKARSVNVPDDGQTYSGKPLPGEHGFRFFPGFYKHIVDTMKRIPFSETGQSPQKNGVYGNLTSTSRIMLARYNAEPLITLANFPKNLDDLRVLYKFYKDFIKVGLSAEERALAEAKVLRLMTSCKERRKDEYEKLGWWEYMDAGNQSTTYQHLLAGGMVRTLVAAQAKFASTKTGGNVFLQLLFNIATPGVNTDRVLNGPTNERWLNPWLNYLTQKGVKYYLRHEGLSFDLDKRNISGVNISDSTGRLIKVSGDYYILATPVEAATKLVGNSPGMEDADETLASLSDLAKSVSWMNGIQFYLNENVTVSNGHVIYSDSEWAITSISQVQFWKNFDISKCYNGKVKGVLSVDVSDWLNTTFNGKLAKNCTHEEIQQGVWAQLKQSLNINGQQLLRDNMVEYCYIDSDIHDADKGAMALNAVKDFDSEKRFNLEPLLVNTVHSWTLRPEARTNITNLFLAADYVRTNTDLATMEGANEAARRAVNCIIDASGVNKPYCCIWPLSEPWIFAPLKWYDNLRYKKGLPHVNATPWYMKLIMVPWLLAYIIQFAIRALVVLIFGRWFV